MNYIKLPSGILVPDTTIITTEEIIKHEINNSAISKKFKEHEIQDLMTDYEDMYGFDGI
jgi:hypothetical protein